MHKRESILTRWVCQGAVSARGRVPYLGAGTFQPQQLGQVVPGRVVDGVLKHLDLLHQGQVVVVRSHLHQDTSILREQPKTSSLNPRRNKAEVRAELGSNFATTAKRRSEIRTLQREKMGGAAQIGFSVMDI